MFTEIFNRKQNIKIPDKKKVALWVDEMFDWLFLKGNEITYADFYNKGLLLQENLVDMMRVVLEPKDASEVADRLFSKITNLHSDLIDDAKHILTYDPAAKTLNEVLVAYPGFYAVTFYRIAHELWIENVPVIPRLISEYIHSKAGIDIHPGATIGKHFMIDHGTGVVIGETAVIGNYVKIYQGVTLGALSVSKENGGVKRHPTIKNHVTIYANATILGGDTIINDHVVVGGNVWITSSIAAHTLVYHKSEVVIKHKQVFPEPINYTI